MNGVYKKLRADQGDSLIDCSEPLLMEELSAGTVSLPFRMRGSALCDKQLEITQLKLIADAAGLVAAATDLLRKDEQVKVESSLGDVEIQIVSGCKSSVTGRVSLCLELHAETGQPRCEAEEGDVDKLAVDSASGFLQVIVPEIIGATVENSQGTDGSVRGNKSVFLIDYVPLWGSVSIKGERPEMEDAFVVVPHFYDIPLWMMIGKQAVDGLDPDLVRLPTHFFGVYDGHGGAQVANYCRERIHDVLIEQLCNTDKGFDCSSTDDRKKHWERAFTECFEKVDDEVAGKVRRGNPESVGSFGDDGDVDAMVEPIAAETVGSTAVVALICSSHIIVANCGDSRAVLCFGKQVMPLSLDHKPNREDEYARIEAQGGKVIHWNGHRVLGVLAMSRAIGDRFLKPWIIPEPEVTIIPRSREDECLILASDGLWDVMSNEEVCDIARKRILLWHKKNGTLPSAYQRGEGADPAAQSAADYLSKLAIQKGSKDNITVIVVDLKARRKLKNKS